MPTVYSAQRTLDRAAVNGTGNSYNDGILDQGGKVRVAYANYTSAAEASGTTIEMLKLPKNARVLSGQLVTGALGTSVTSAVGTDVALVDDAGTVLTAAGTANLLAATATASASNTAIAATRLLGAGGVTTAETTVSITTGGATNTASINISLWVLYVQN